MNVVRRRIEAPPETEHYWVRPPQGRAEWLASRSTYLGASDMPVIAGATSGTWGSPYALQAEKLGLIERERNPTTEKMMRAGNRMEPLILGDLAHELDVDVETFGHTLISKRWPWLGCTPDGIVYPAPGMPKKQTAGDGHTFYQAKNSMGFERWEVTSSGKLEPRRVWVQVQAEMAVTGHPWCYVAAMLGGWDFRWARIERDSAYIEEQLIPAGEVFMAHLESREMLPVDWAEATTKALASIYPEPAEPRATVTLPAQMIDDDERFESLKAEAKGLAQEMDTIRNRVRDEMGTAYRAEVPGSSAYWLWSGGARGRRLVRYPGKDGDT